MRRIHINLYSLLACALVAGMLLAARPVIGASLFPEFWWQEAQRWPAVAEAEFAASPEAATVRFTRWVAEVLPAEQFEVLHTEKIPFLRGWGYHFTQESPDARLQLREVMTPVYAGASVFTSGVVLCIELRAPVPLPTTGEAMRVLLSRHLNPQRLDWPQDPRYKQPEFARDDTSAVYAMPNDFYAWTDGRIIRAAVYEIPASSRPLSILARLPEDRGGAQRYQPSADGSLNYPLEPDMENPWLILAALDWPATDPEQVRADTMPPPDFAEARFAQRLRDILHADWQPNAEVPYWRHGGFVHLAERDGYRLRARETVAAMPRLKRSMVMAIEPTEGTLPELQDITAMRAMLSRFLRSELLEAPALDACPIRLQAHAGGWHYAQYRQEDLERTPLDLFAWSNGAMLLIALPDSPFGECATCVE